MYLPIQERVPGTGLSMGFLKIFRYLYCHRAMHDLIKHDQNICQISSDRQPRLSSMLETLS